jgi:prophage regulatory protein
MQTDRFLTDRQIAERYGVSRCTPWRWARNGDFPKPEQISAGTTRWRESIVLEWEAQNNRQSLERG